MAKDKRVKIPKSLVTTFVRVWNENNDSSKVCEEYINYGWCYQFAVVIKRTFPNVKIYTDLDGGHCWVKIGDYFYDSEHLNGTKQNLSMASWGEDWQGPVTVKTIQRIWYGANSGPVNIQTIDKVVREWKQLYSKENK
jgi:hypothetical protein